MKQIQCIAIVFALALPFSAFAADKAERGGPKTDDTSKTTESTNKPLQFVGPITAVSAEEKSITIDDARLGKHKLLISDATKLLHGDKTATWDDLKVGTKVEGTCMPDKEAAQVEQLTIKE